MLVTLKEQQYVCTLACYQNLHKAAQELSISPPALSIAISNLEHNLGINLFERTGKKLLLTYAGERYVYAAEQMLALKENFDHEIQEMTENYKGRLRLGCQSRRSSWFLPPVIAAYEREFPYMETVVETGNIRFLKQKLDNYELDFLLCNAGDAEALCLEKKLIYREMILVALPPCHPANEKAVYVSGKRYRYLDLSVLQGETFILQYPEQSLRRDADRLLKRKKVFPGRIRELENIETAMQFIAEGLGVGFNREGYLSTMRYSKKVNYYGLMGQEKTVDFVLVYRKNMEVTTPVKRMIEMLTERGRNYYK